ncbi:unnamed protein product [Phyllotreta striolata]|uniref:Gustatory receptor n=1 Tax=Phyllotreta striolata TaxID=444603 RepID=A0A9N9XMR8_PHYSR|nr:unnamed protein product [Phyllotreta striolata]
MSQDDDVVKATLPVWVFCQMFGLCFSSTKAIASTKIPSRKRNVGKFVYWFATVSIALHLSFYNFSYELDPSKNVVIQAGDILNGLSSIAATVSSIFTSFLFENRILTVMKDLCEVNDKLKKYPKSISYKGIKKFAYAEIIYLLNSWIYFLISYVITCPSNLAECLGSWYLMYTITKIFDVNLARFISHMSIVYKQLCTLNSNILHLSEERYVISLNLPKERYKIDALENFKEIYSEILRIGEEINYVHSFSLLLIIANQFISIFSSLYFCFFGYYINGNYIKPNSLSTLLVPLMSLIHPGGQLLAIAIVCQLTISESKQTGKIIYRIPINRNARTLMQRINLFSLHIMHKQFDITACGFFSINCALLLMVGIDPPIY